MKGYYVTGKVGSCVFLRVQSFQKTLLQSRSSEREVASSIGSAHMSAQPSGPGIALALPLHFLSFCLWKAMFSKSCGMSSVGDFTDTHFIDHWAEDKYQIPEVFKSSNNFQISHLKHNSLKWSPLLTNGCTHGCIVTCGSTQSSRHHGQTQLHHLGKEV